VIDEYQLPREVRQRALSAGDEGAEWIESLPSTVSKLARKWRFEPGEVMTGGTESLILRSEMSDGSSAIVKIGFPATCDCAHEARLLRLAHGRGYVELYDADEQSNALLLECLGGMLASANIDVDERIERLCAVMKSSWVDLKPLPGLMTGGEKALWLADFIQEKWSRLPDACHGDTVECALEFCHERAAAHDDAKSCLVHGDAHDQNALFDKNDDLKLIDPDGMLAEPACDLAVPMREWSGELLAGDTPELGVARCRMIADLTGVDERAIWQWGFMERVSSGLGCLDVGLEFGRDMLEVADQFRAVQDWG
jgi:streptomycin 6-kinase